MVIGGWLIAALTLALMSVGLRYRLETAGYIAAGAWILVGIAGLVIALLLQFAREEHFYNIILAWMSLVHLVLFGQLTNFYFGAESHLILQGTVPILMLAIPVAIVGVRAMLKSPDANRLNFVLLLGLSLMTLTHALLRWSEAETHYAMVLMMTNVMVAGPLLELMMHQHYRIQSRAERSLRRALAEAQQAANDARRKSLLDPLTGLLNRRGIQESIASALKHNESTGIARISVTNLGELQKSCQEQTIDSMLRELAELLRQKADSPVKLGRMDGGEFDLWRAWDGDEADWDHACQALTQHLRLHFEDAELVPSLVCAAAVYPQETESHIALEDISFRSFLGAVRA